jgi:thioesterase domain-containing protein
MVHLSDLARSLPRRSIVGFTAPGVNEGTPLAVVEELAGLFRRELLEQGYRPPYTIVGSCAGGAVAIELAQQLGWKQVEVVALIDSWLPTTGEPEPWDDLIEMFTI